MIRVTFDSDYVANLEDYYRRNECIREQQYLSQEKLLHLAAFCISKVVNDVHDSCDSRRTDHKTEEAIDAVRQLSLLCETVDPGEAQFKPVTIVIGQTNNEGQNQERHTSTSAATTLVKRSFVRSLWSWATAGSVVCDMAQCLRIRTKTPHI